MIVFNQVIRYLEFNTCLKFLKFYITDDCTEYTHYAHDFEMLCIYVNVAFRRKEMVHTVEVQKTNWQW